MYEICSDTKEQRSNLSLLGFLFWVLLSQAPSTMVPMTLLSDALIHQQVNVSTSYFMFPLHFSNTWGYSNNFFHGSHFAVTSELDASYMFHFILEN